MSSMIAEQKGLLPTAQASAILDVYARLGLPCSIKGITSETYKRARDEIVVHRDGLLRAPNPNSNPNPNPTPNPSLALALALTLTSTLTRCAAAGGHRLVRLRGRYLR